MPFPGGMIKQRDGGGGIPLRELEQTNPSGESLVTKPSSLSDLKRADGVPAGGFS